MSALTDYVHTINRMNKIFGAKVYDIEDAEDRKALLAKIECDLSPENLTCDGELPAATVRKRYNQLTRAQKELEKMA